MNEDYQEFNSNSDLHTATDSERSELDYEKIEDSFYNALKRIEEDKEQFESSELVESESELLDFASPTDSNLYTVKVAAAPANSEQQQTAFLLDIRNVLFLFLICYFVFTVYGKLSRSVKSLYRGDN